MARELVVTSAPRGVKLGRTGFQVVMRTAGLREDVTEALEKLGDYRHVHPAGSGRNPTIYAFRRVRTFGGELAALVRSVDAGHDFSSRSNKLTHVVALDSAELAGLQQVSPPALLRALDSQGLLASAWPGEPEERPAGPRLPSATSLPRRCSRWAEQAGDAGWAGVIAERALRGAPTLVVAADSSPASSQILLDLFDEVYSLLPPSRRWEIPFETTLVATNSPAALRGTYAGSPESATPGTALLVDLAARVPVPLEFEGSDLVSTARTGSARRVSSTTQAGKGPHPAVPLPVPGGPPLGLPENSDPYGFDNLLTDEGFGPPPVPGGQGPPLPPPPGGIVPNRGRGGDDEPAESARRNPALLSAAIVAVLLLILAIGVGVYAGIRLLERSRAVRKLNEIVNQDAGPEAKPDDVVIVEKAFWPNTDWWYFRDPIRPEDAKTARFISLLRERNKENPNQQHTQSELLALWKSWDELYAWPYKDPASLLTALEPLGPNFRLPQPIDEGKLKKPPPWGPKNQNKPITLAILEAHIQSLKPQPPPEPVAAGKPAPEEGMQAPPQASTPTTTPPQRTPEQDSVERIIAYARGQTDEEPSGEDVGRFPTGKTGDPKFKLTDFIKLFNSAIRARGEKEDWKNLPDDQQIIEKIQNEIIHALYVLFKTDPKTNRFLAPDEKNEDFKKHFSSIGIETKQGDRERYQKNINSKLDEFAKDPFTAKAAIPDSVLADFVGTLDIEGLKKLMSDPADTPPAAAQKPPASPTTVMTPPPAPQPKVDVGTPEGTSTVKELLLSGKAEVIFAKKRSPEVVGAIEKLMDRDTVQILKHMGFSRSFSDGANGLSTSVQFDGKGMKTDKGDHPLENFEDAATKGAVLQLFQRLQQSNEKIEWLGEEKGKNKFPLKYFFSADGGCGSLEKYVPDTLIPAYDAELKREAESRFPMPEPPRNYAEGEERKEFEVKKNTVIKERDDWIGKNSKDLNRLSSFWRANYLGKDPSELNPQDPPKKPGKSSSDDANPENFRKWVQTIVLLEWIKTNIDKPLKDVLFPKASK